MKVLQSRVNLLVSDALLRCRSGADGVDLAIVLMRMIMVMMIMVMVIMVMVIIAMMIMAMMIMEIVIMVMMIMVMLRMLTTMIAPTMVVQSVHVLAEAKATKAEMVRIRVLMFLKILKSRKKERWKWMDKSLGKESVIVGHKAANRAETVFLKNLKIKN